MQAADSDYEELGDLFVGPVVTSDLSAYPCHSPKTTQEDDDPPDNQGSDITRYGESNLVAEPQKVKMEHGFYFLVVSRDLCHLFLNESHVGLSLSFFFLILSHCYPSG